MSDETQTPPKDVAPAAATPATTAPNGDAVSVAMRSLQDDNRRLDSELKAALAKLGERDTEVATYKAQVEGYGKEKREAAIVSRLRNVLPHTTEFEIRSSLAGLHEAGKIDRYSDKPDEAAVAAFELIKVEAPSLTRQPTAGGGTNGARVDPGAKLQRKMLI